jgi:hypothetical protein
MPTETDCVIYSITGRSVVTDSAESAPEGSRFVAVVDAANRQLGYWPIPEVADTDALRAGLQVVMRNLWHGACEGLVIDDPGYGFELCFPLERGEVRACLEGTYVRVVCLAQSAPVELAYWSVDEWIEDPRLVFGAILGAARPLSSRPVLAGV